MLQVLSLAIREWNYFSVSNKSREQQRWSNKTAWKNTYLSEGVKSWGLKKYIEDFKAHLKIINSFTIL